VANVATTTALRNTPLRGVTYRIGRCTRCCWFFPLPRHAHPLHRFPTHYPTVRCRYNARPPVGPVTTVVVLDVPGDVSAFVMTFTGLPVTHVDSVTLRWRLPCCLPHYIVGGVFHTTCWFLRGCAWTVGLPVRLQFSCTFILLYTVCTKHVHLCQLPSFVVLLPLGDINLLFLKGIPYNSVYYNCILLLFDLFLVLLLLDIPKVGLSLVLTAHSETRETGRGAVTSISYRYIVPLLFVIIPSLFPFLIHLTTLPIVYCWLYCCNLFIYVVVPYTWHPDVVTVPTPHSVYSAIVVILLLLCGYGC